MPLGKKQGLGKLGFLLGEVKGRESEPDFYLHRSALESSLDLSDQEKYLLLAALIPDYEQKARKLEQEEQETEGSRKGSSSR